MVIEERPANIGNFWVGRLLPFREKRTVGPFAFIDHMGPAKLSDHENFDVGPHPHIGLSTLTYLFEGAIMHRDSLGNEIEILPGQVNWMTSGKGIVHSERTPERLRQSDKSLHGLQIWVALPKDLEQCEPSFAHIEGTGLPEWQENGLQYKLIAGEIMGHKSAVPVFSPLYLLEIKSDVTQTVQFNGALYGESGLYILEGGVETEGHTFGPKQLLVAKDATLCEFVIQANTTLYLFGGEPLAEPRYIYWNFVSSDAQLIEDAKERWVNDEFPKILGEHGRVPLPEINPNLTIKKQ